MITVFVRHYLNEAGREYFDAEWYPYVLSIIEKQPGFINITTSNDEDVECRNITVQFKNKLTLDDWVAHEDHQKVIHDLDPYRTKPWHYLMVEIDNPIRPTSLNEWNEVSLG